MAANTTTTTALRIATPFVKWVGGKTRLLDELVHLAPPTFAAYHEKMVGGGALFWRLASTGKLTRGRVFLSDTCAPLIRAYRGVRDFPREVAVVLDAMPLTREDYLRIRSLDPGGMTPTNAAAWFIYLNKTCFNGLWRVNSKGRFNVPCGLRAQDKLPKLYEAENLYACSELLKEYDVKLEVATYTTRPPLQGDFVYFDPPYVPVSSTANFVGYCKDGFNHDQQVALRDHAAALKRRGVRVMLSNSDTPITRDLYGNFSMHSVQVGRTVNSKASERGKKTGELIIT